MTKPDYAKGYWNPFVAGIALGLVLLLTFYIMGTGLGASGAVARTAAVVTHAIDPQLVEKNQYFKEFYKPGGDHPLVDWMVFEVIGVFIGGIVAVLTARRFNISVGKGASFPVILRLILAFGGGIIGGIGTRFAMGCTSGQALSGGATMALGSWVFMMMVFATAFVAAYFVRKEWQ
ncbi:MAG: YeeE/YedE thiosulfate transporter family protein [Deltaproteobacteria bacterium]|nr:YeeE/YedE thiosulfate transporter family protein [Deltaproteobacteria bacterium]